MDGVPAPQRDRKTDPNSRILDIFFFAANEREWTPMSRKIFGCGLSTPFATKEFIARLAREAQSPLVHGL